MDIAQRAQRARVLLEDPLLKEAFDVLESEQVRIFTGDLCNPEQIMEAHRMVRALRQVQAYLAERVTDQKMHEARIAKGQHRG